MLKSEAPIISSSHGHRLDWPEKRSLLEAASTARIWGGCLWIRMRKKKLKFMTHPPRITPIDRMRTALDTLWYAIVLPTLSNSREQE